jgi:hypothetical protein
MLELFSLVLGVFHVLLTLVALLLTVLVYAWQ